MAEEFRTYPGRCERLLGRLADRLKLQLTADEFTHPRNVGVASSAANDPVVPVIAITIHALDATSYDEHSRMGDSVLPDEWSTIAKMPPYR